MPLVLDAREEILRIANAYLERVRPSGNNNIMALCPFHRDNTPSFAMNVNTGVYLCHSCQAKGNLVTFLRRMGVTRVALDLQYRDILEAARAATPAKPDALNPGVYSLKTIPESFLGNFDGWTLHSLLDSGFREETLHYFDVGFDRWHGRITFPIRDAKGDIVAISGRTIHPGERPRYKYYNKEYTLWGMPEHGEWDRGKVLYNGHNVLPALLAHEGHKAPVTLVEGQKATMWVSQAGVPNTMGLLGTYLSWEHKWLLSKYDSTFYLLLDNNEAGQIGTHKAFATLKDTENIGSKDCDGLAAEIRVVEYPERLRDDPRAQPNDMTQEEVLAQHAAAVLYEDWRERHTDTIPTPRSRATYRRGPDGIW